MGARLGLIVPFDTANDREYWRWVPHDTSVHITRTGFHSGPLDVALAETTADPDEVAYATKSMTKIEPDVIAYACTSGSFVGGLRGEQRLRDLMTAAGAARAVTTSGAMLDALRVLGARRVSLATPYPSSVGERLVTFIEEAGFEAVSLENLGLEDGEDIQATSDDEIIELGRKAMRPEADVLFISCTGLGTIDLVPRLELALGKPALTAVQVTMWGAMRAAGVRSPIVDQALFRGSAAQVVATTR